MMGGAILETMVSAKFEYVFIFIFYYCFIFKFLMEIMVIIFSHNLQNFLSQIFML